MTFSQKVKEEICRNNYELDEKKALLSSYLKNIVAINISNNKIDWEIKSKVPLTLRFITKLLNELYQIKKDLFISEKKSEKFGRTYKLEFLGNFELIEKELYIFNDPSEMLTTDNLKAAFLTGVFLSGGSINNPQSSNYHFEISIHNEDLLKIVENIFNHFELKYSILERKNKFVIYVKKSETISDLLKLMGTSLSMFEFEEKRIYRDYSNQLSRLNNLDLSNIKKTALASYQQVIYINYLKENGLMSKLSDKERKFCTLRLENQEASLNDLVSLFYDEYKIRVSRTGINHFVRKIKKIYEENHD